MFKKVNLLTKVIIFSVPILLCLYIQQALAKREIEIKVVRQEAHEIISEVKVNHHSQFLLTTVSGGIMITSPKYNTQTIDDMVILMESLGLYGVQLLPAGHPE